MSHLLLLTGIFDRIRGVLFHFLKSGGSWTLALFLPPANEFWFCYSLYLVSTREYMALPDWGEIVVKNHHTTPHIRQMSTPPTPELK